MDVGYEDLCTMAGIPPWLSKSSQKRHLILSSSVMSDGPTYVPKPTIKNTFKVTLQAGTVGLVLSTVQNALGKHTHGAMGVLTRTGGTIGFFGNNIPNFLLLYDSNIFYHLAAMGATFAFTEAFVANERQKNDALNGAAGGCAAGFLTGIRCKF
jgi:hypothetical protein